MNAKEYQQLALRTATNLDKPEELMLNGILGLTGEAGECADIVKKYKYQGHPLDAAKLAEELGDVLWYVAILAEALGTDLTTIMQKNINKLKARYPKGFDAERSIHRKEKGYVVVD